MQGGNFSCVVALGGASLAAERSPSGARADGARRSQTARAWPRAAQHNEFTISRILFI